MRQPVASSALVGGVAVVTVYVVVALLLLRQWGETSPWSRLNVFAVAGITFNALLAAQQARSQFRLPASKDVQNEAWGYSFDPGLAPIIGMLGAAELLVYLDYGKWQLAPRLSVPMLQWTGVALAATTLSWLVWVDRYLVRHFASADARRQIMTEGPYRLVRHPRYLGLILSRIAVALVFASAIAWALLAGWTLAVLRRIALEERHLQRLFGEQYSSYARSRARLLPWIY